MDLKNKATLGMLVAVTAVSKGYDVTLFLAAYGVHLLNCSKKATVVGLGTGDLKDHLDSLKQSGTKIFVSGMSAKARGYDDNLFRSPYVVIPAFEPLDTMSFVIRLVPVMLLFTSSAPVKVVAPVTARVVSKVTAPVDDNVPPTAVFPAIKLPSTSTASPNVIFEESAALKVVPLIVIAPATMLPVPPGVRFKSAFELVDIVESFIVILSTTAVPLKVAYPLVDRLPKVE